MLVSFLVERHYNQGHLGYSQKDEEYLFFKDQVPLEFGRQRGFGSRDPKA